MTFGEFPGDERRLETRWLKPGVILDRKIDTILPFDPSRIEEHVRHSWYEGEQARAPYEGETAPKFTSMGDTDRYSWMKAPRYDGKVVETGPLAQVLVAYAQGQAAVKPVVDQVPRRAGDRAGSPGLHPRTHGRPGYRGAGPSRGRPAHGWKNSRITSPAATRKSWKTAKCRSPRAGWALSMRPGADSRTGLSLKTGRIANFQLVVPSTWNLGPRDAAGQRSAVEEALIGTPVADPKRPVEILRTVHSFDPCVACGVHVIDGRTNEGYDFRVL